MIDSSKKLILDNKANISADFPILDKNIYGVNGKLLFQKHFASSKPQSYIWTPESNLVSGLLLVKIESRGIFAFQKMIFIQ